MCRKTRIKLYRKSNGICVFCGGKMINPKDEPRVANATSFASCTQDHVIPQKIEKNIPNNSVGACRACNNMRKHIPFDMFLRFRKYLIGLGWKPCTRPSREIRVILSNLGWTLKYAVSCYKAYQ